MPILDASKYVRPPREAGAAAHRRYTDSTDPDSESKAADSWVSAWTRPVTRRPSASTKEWETIFENGSLVS